MAKQKLSAERKKLSSNLVYLDLKTILENYKNPSFWGTDWVIYESGDIKIVWRMTEIDVRRKQIRSEVAILPFVFRNGKKKATIDDSWRMSSYCSSIPIEHSEYTQETFERNILGSALSLIYSVERSIIEKYSEYKYAIELMDEKENELTRIAEEIWEQSSFSDNEAFDDFKDDFIEKYVAKNRVDYTQEIYEKYSYKVLGLLRMALCSWFGDEKRFAEVKERVGDNEKKYTWLKMFKESKKLKTEKWKTAMADAIREQLEELEQTLQK